MSAFTGRFFVLYAGRVKSGDAAGLETAAILATTISEMQAGQDGLWFHDAIWWEYEVLNG